jgi:hypothetical protein
MSIKLQIFIAVVFGLIAGLLISLVYKKVDSENREASIYWAMQSSSMVQLAELLEKGMSEGGYSSGDYLHCALIEKLTEIEYGLKKYEKPLHTVAHDGVTAYEKVSTDVERVKIFIDNKLSMRCPLIQG